MATLPQAQKRLPNGQILTYGRLTWTNIEKPGPDDIAFLSDNYPFHPLDLEDCLSRIQRPKIDEYEDYLFLVLHFPVYNKTARVTTPSQVAIFIGEDYLITIHSGNLKTLVRFFKECNASETTRQQNMGRSSGFLLYAVLDRLVDYCYPILNKIGANVEDVEDRVFSQDSRRTVQELSVLRRDIIAYRRIIRPQIGVIASLEQRERPFLKEDLEAYFGDIADHIGEIWDALEDYKEVIDGLNDTNNTLTSYRINDVMRVLTIISTIMLPLSVISGIYGMNVSLPLEGHPLAYAFVVLLMAVITVSMLTVFRFKRWI